MKKQLQVAAILLSPMLRTGLADSSDAPPRPVQSATMVYGLARGVAEADFQRLLKAEPLDYVLVEASLQSSQEIRTEERARIKALSAAGKKVILQLWFGPEAWGHYAFPHFAFDRKLLDKFMKEMVAPRLADFDKGD